MYIVIAICVTITLILCVVAFLLSKREKFGKIENEIKHWKILGKTIEKANKSLDASKSKHIDDIVNELRDKTDT